MTTLVLKNRVSKQKLDTVVLVLKAMNINAEIKKSVRKRTVKKEFFADSSRKQKDLFAESFGMWADRDVDIKEMRKETHERRTKYYDNATL